MTATIMRIPLTSKVPGMIQPAEWGLVPFKGLDEKKVYIPEHGGSSSLLVN